MSGLLEVSHAEYLGCCRIDHVSEGAQPSYPVVELSNTSQRLTTPQIRRVENMPISDHLQVWPYSCQRRCTVEIREGVLPSKATALTTNQALVKQPNC